jgi:type II secretory pathway component GspD/PulD (secretin)
MVNTLSTPKILAIHGKQAKVQVGGQQGYEVAVVSEGVIVPDVKFIDTGTILEITPYIDDKGNVLLNVKPEIKSAVIEEGIPVVNTTVVSTWLLAKNGETVFIGGLIQDTKTKARESIPCLGSIPGLGVLFGRTARGIGKSELIILITPQILDAELKRTDQEAIEKTKKIEEDFKKEPLPPYKLPFESFSPPSDTSEESHQGQL